MLYKSYYNKTQKVANVLTRIYRLRVPIILFFSALALTGVALAAAKGFVVSDSFQMPEVVYGESVSYEANAFLGDVIYEYRRADGTEWTTEPPDEIGDYVVRAVGTSFFGKPRYSAEHSFTISPRPLVVSVVERELVYGETPTVTASLLAGHTIEGTVPFPDVIAGKDPEVTPDRDSIRIKDAAGNDVTANYTISELQSSVLTIVPRPIEVAVEDREKTYDGVELTFDTFACAEGALVDNDRIFALVKLTEVDTLTVTPELKIYKDDIDVTHFYDITLLREASTLTVNLRPLCLVPNAGTWEYDGKPHSSLGYDFADEGNEEPPLVDGHEIKVLENGSASLVDVGRIPNELRIQVLDKDGEDKTANYSPFIMQSENTFLEVTPREVLIQSSSGSFEYNGAYHTSTDFTATLQSDPSQSAVAEGDLFEVVSSTEIRDVMESGIDNNLSISVTRGDKDVSMNYRITYAETPGKLTVTPRPVTLVTGDLEIIYDAEGHTQPAHTLTYGDTTSNEAVKGDTLNLFDLPVVQNVTAAEGVSNTATWSFTRLSEDGVTTEDITENYKVTPKFGTLKVTHRPITVTAGTAAFIYDGQPHTYNHKDTYSIVYTGEEAGKKALVGGAQLLPTIAGEGTLVSEHTDAGYIPYKNRVTDWSITMPDPEDPTQSIDVAENYRVTTVEGSITILPRPITVRAQDKTFLYDGTEKDWRYATYTWSEKPTDDPVWDLVEQMPEGEVLMDGDLPPEVVYNESCVYINACRYTPGSGVQSTYPNRIDSITIRSQDETDVSGNYLITPVDGSITILPRPISVIAGSRTWLYDGEAHSYADGTAYKIEWSETPDELGWEGFDWNREATPLLEIHTESVNITGEYTNACRMENGAYVPYENRMASVSIFATAGGAEEDSNVTSNYLITLVSGELLILPRPITIRSHDAEKIYDSSPLTNSDYSIYWTPSFDWSAAPWCDVQNKPDLNDADSWLAHGQMSNVKVSIVASPIYVRRDVDRTILPYSNTIDLSQTIIPLDGGENNIANYLVEVLEGELVIRPCPITIRTEGEGYVWYYSDEARVLDGVSSNIAELDLSDIPHRVEPVGNYLSEILPRESVYENVHEVIILSSGTAEDGEERDVTDCFELSYQYGRYTIEKRPLVITAGSAVKIYDATPLRCSTYEPSLALADAGFDDIFGGLLTQKGHELVFAIVDGEQTDADTSPNVYRPKSAIIMKGDMDVTDYYDISGDEGTLEVKPRPVIITTLDGIWIYDGKVHKQEASVTRLDDDWTNPEWTYVQRPDDETGILPGHKLKLNYDASCRDVMGVEYDGSYSSISNSISGQAVTLATDDNITVSRNYRLLVETGTLTILPRPVTVASNDGTWIYNGEPQWCRDVSLEWAGKPVGEQWDLVELDESVTALSALCDGDTLPYVTGFRSITTVQGGNLASGYGTLANEFDIDSVRFATNSFGVSNYLMINCEFGALAILPRPITVTTASGVFEYNGKVQSHKNPMLQNPTLDTVLPRTDGQWANVELPTGTALISGHRPAFQFATCQYVETVPVKNEILNIRENDCIRDAWGNPVAENYYITVNAGELTVTPYTLTIVYQSYPAVGEEPIFYDGQAHIFDDFMVYDASSGMLEELFPGHEATSLGAPYFTNADTYENSFELNIMHDGRNVSNCFIIDPIVGTVVIEKRPVYIQINQILPYTQGLAQKADQAIALPDHTGGMPLVEGHSIRKVETNGEGTLPGQYIVEYVEDSAVIVDTATGDNVSGNYDIRAVSPCLLNITLDFEGIVGTVVAPQSGNMYLRENSFGFYNGSTDWAFAAPYDGTLNGGYSYNYLPAYYLAGLGEQTQTVRFSDMVLGLMPYYMATGSENASTLFPTLIQNSDTLYIKDQSKPNYSVPYFPVSNPPPHLLAASNSSNHYGSNADAEKAYSAWVNSPDSQYLQIQDSTREVMQAIIDAEGFDKNSIAVYINVINYIRESAAYDRDYDLRLDQEADVAAAFLGDGYDKGVSRHFATSATMLFRALGIPARYTTGYLVPAVAGEEVEIISSKDELDMKYAWVEVYIDGLGWVMLDPVAPQEPTYVQVRPITVVKEYGEVVTYDYENIEGVDDLLAELLKAGFTLSGFNKDNVTFDLEAGLSYINDDLVLLDPSGRPSDLYRIEKQPGSVKITEMLVKVWLYEWQQNYITGPMIAADEDYYTVLTLPEGYTMDLTVSLTIARALTLGDLNGPNSGEFVQYQIWDENGVDVTERVTLLFVADEKGIFDDTVNGHVIYELTKADLELTAGSKTVVYDPENPIKLTADSYKITGIKTGESPLAPGHYIVADMITYGGECDYETAKESSCWIERGTVYILDAEGRNVTDNYNIDLKMGTLEFVEPESD